MSITGYILLALALAMDCFSVSLTCGMIQKSMGRQAWGMALLFGFFQALMPLLGWIAADTFKAQISAYDHWIAFGLLVFLGGKMLYQDLYDRFCRQKSGFPETQHLDPSSFNALLTLAVATSIDALAVGFSFLSFGIRGWRDVIIPLLIIATGSFVMSLLGKAIGIRLGRRFNFPAEIIGGLVLIGIGVKVLIQHLCT